MIKRLEQVAALVVTAGLAIVSYWLFFSWAQGGSLGRPAQRSRLSQAPAGLQQPLLARTVIKGGDMGLHLLARDRQVLAGTNRHDSL
jgi:hypothetical protein